MAEIVELRLWEISEGPQPNPFRPSIRKAAASARPHISRDVSFLVSSVPVVDGPLILAQAALSVSQDWLQTLGRRTCRGVFLSNHGADDPACINQTRSVSGCLIFRLDS